MFAAIETPPDEGPRTLPRPPSRVYKNQEQGDRVWLADDVVSFVLFLVQILVSIALPDNAAAKPIFPRVSFEILVAISHAISGSSGRCL